MKNFFITIAVFTTLLLPSLSLVYAQQGSVGQGQGSVNTSVVGIKNPLNSSYSNIPSILNGLINVVLKIAEVLCALYIIYGGFLYVQAQGKPEALTRANQTLLHAVIGTAIILGANVIYSVINSTITSIKSAS